MENIEVGAQAPDFSLPSDNGGQVSLSSLRGRRVVLYFYPRDDTPGCTVESCSFRDNMQALNALNVDVIGISKDTPESHDRFKQKYELNFPLASDADSDVCERYGVWKEKNMYGKKSMGIERSTFLIGEDGNVEKIWRKVKVEGHVEDVMAALR
ncbi:MAG: thioredoxin-dependent thiol peroxidase [Alphaproteobacteria bacterium]|nr:thioredoxin-dependent thiol peroxidase [Alphaproteobacteria bacterium]